MSVRAVLTCTLARSVEGAESARTESYAKVQWFLDATTVLIVSTGCSVVGARSAVDLGRGANASTVDSAGLAMNVVICQRGQCKGCGRSR